MKYFMIELVIFYITMLNFIGVKKFFKEIPIIDNIKIIMIMLIIADIIYIVKKKIKWKQALREYLILKVMIFNIISIFFTIIKY